MLREVLFSWPHSLGLIDPFKPGHGPLRKTYLESIQRDSSGAAQIKWRILVGSSKAGNHGSDPGCGQTRWFSLGQWFSSPMVRDMLGIIKTDPVWGWTSVHFKTFLLANHIVCFLQFHVVQVLLVRNTRTFFANKKFTRYYSLMTIYPQFVCACFMFDAEFFFFIAFKTYSPTV